MGTLLAAAFVVLGLLAPLPSSAQDDAAGNQPEQALVAPKLERFVEAPFPSEALEHRVAGEVVLLLTIDPSGAVVDARVESGPGHGLDEAARAAALEFEFEPAYRGDQPITSRIRYRYQFALPRDSVANAESPPKESESPSDTASDTPQGERSKGALTGHVTLPDGDSPAVGSRVTLTGPDGSERVVRTDEGGRFSAEDLAPGRYDIRAQSAGLGTTSLTTEVLAGEETQIALRLEGDDDAAPIEVTVKGQSTGEQLQQSARAVEVVDTEEASKESADMGEVLAREEGIGVRRTGGLGSGTRFSLNGLTDKQIRFFLDGIPLEFAGYPGGIASVPVNLVERIDIYKGVVPVHLGADALGGAVELVTTDTPEDGGLRASYQFGSFNTHRTALSGHFVTDSGLYARADGFFDYATNDYDVDVEYTDVDNQLSTQTVPRFHDAYRSAGGGLEVGLTDQDWAERLSLRLFGSDLSRELQHDSVMSLPFGEAVWEQSVVGGYTRYEHRPTPSTHVNLATGYNFTTSALDDVTECRWNWYGQCVRRRDEPGEIGEPPSDRTIWEHAAFARLNGTWNLANAHTVRLSAAPTFVTRTGEERTRVDNGERDPLSAQRDLFSFVAGLEYQADLIDKRLQNIAFVKDYLQLAYSEEVIETGAFVDRDRVTHQLGVGDSLRYRLNDWSWVKASYEWATRLPTAGEIFGDSLFIGHNLDLRPERSHNVNLEYALDGVDSPVGTWRGQVTGFYRHVDDQIELQGNNDEFTYNNVTTARALGVETAAGWTAPGGVAALDGNLTYVDLRNISEQGAFAAYAGDRIPNRPYLFANGAARASTDDVVLQGDTVSLAWRTRYVHWFYRGWESVGLKSSKQFIPTQLQHGVTVTHSVDTGERVLTTTFEVQNLTDAKLYDFFGVQRPGRAFYVKTTLDF